MGIDNIGNGAGGYFVIIINQNERVGKFVADLIGNSSWYEYQAIGQEISGELVAGVVIDSYVKNARCSIHCAGIGKKWLNREFLFFVFDYVFKKLNCKVVVNPVNSNNRDSVRFTSHLGFREVARIEGGYEDGDLIIFALPRNECKWIEVNHGKK